VIEHVVFGKRASKGAPRRAIGLSPRRPDVAQSRAMPRIAAECCGGEAPRRPRDHFQLLIGLSASAL
jgi:hypothetical protein